MFTARDAPVSVLLIVTVAAGIAAPEVSETLPEIEPPVTWPSACSAK